MPWGLIQLWRRLLVAGSRWGSLSMIQICCGIPILILTRWRRLYSLGVLGLLIACLTKGEGVLPGSRTNGADIVVPGLLIRVMERTIRFKMCTSVMSRAAGSLSCLLGYRWWSSRVLILLG